jgi:hypothetical protein
MIATPARRRLALGVLLALAVAGGVIRHQAPNPSTLRDVGTLMLVLWLPAVGNLVAYLISKLPRRKGRTVAFAPDAPFTAHLVAGIVTLPLPAGWLERLDRTERKCTAVVGHHAFTVRAEVPLAQWLAAAPQTLALECLVPSAALGELLPGTKFHLVVGPTAVASAQTR